MRPTGEVDSLMRKLLNCYDGVVMMYLALRGRKYSFGLLSLIPFLIGPLITSSLLLFLPSRLVRRLKGCKRHWGAFVKRPQTSSRLAVVGVTGQV